MIVSLFKRLKAVTFILIDRQDAPVDKLLFLNYRGQVKTNPAAILLSSEGGTARFWSLAGQERQRGKYLPKLG